MPKGLEEGFRAFDTIISKKLEKGTIPLILLAQTFSDNRDDDLFLLYPEMRDYLPVPDLKMSQAKIADAAPKILNFYAISSVGYAIYNLSARGELPKDNIYDIFKNKDFYISQYRHDYWGNQFFIERLDNTKILIFSLGNNKKRDLPKTEDLVSLSSEKWIKYMKQNDDIGAIIFLDK